MTYMIGTMVGSSLNPHKDQSIIMQTNRPKNHSAKRPALLASFLAHRWNGACVPVIGDGGRIQRRPLRCVRELAVSATAPGRSVTWLISRRLNGTRPYKSTLPLSDSGSPETVRAVNGITSGWDRCTGRVAYELPTTSRTMGVLAPVARTTPVHMSGCPMPAAVARMPQRQERVPPGLHNQV